MLAILSSLIKGRKRKPPIASEFKNAKEAKKDEKETKPFLVEYPKGSLDKNSLNSALRVLFELSAREQLETKDRSKREPHFWKTAKSRSAIYCYSSPALTNQNLRQTPSMVQAARKIFHSDSFLTEEKENPDFWLAPSVIFFITNILRNYVFDSHQPKSLFLRFCTYIADDNYRFLLNEAAVYTPIIVLCLLELRDAINQEIKNVADQEAQEQADLAANETFLDNNKEYLVALAELFNILNCQGILSFDMVHSFIKENSKLIPDLLNTARNKGEQFWPNVARQYYYPALGEHGLSFGIRGVITDFLGFLPNKAEIKSTSENEKPKTEEDLNKAPRLGF